MSIVQRWGCSLKFSGDETGHETKGEYLLLHERPAWQQANRLDFRLTGVAANLKKALCCAAYGTTNFSATS